MCPNNGGIYQDILLVMAVFIGDNYDQPLVLKPPMTNETACNLTRQRTAAASGVSGCHAFGGGALTKTQKARHVVGLLALTFHGIQHFGVESRWKRVRCVSCSMRKNKVINLA